MLLIFVIISALLDVSNELQSLEALHYLFYFCAFDCPCYSPDFPSDLLADLLRVLPFSPVRFSFFYKLLQSVFAHTLLRFF